MMPTSNACFCELYLREMRIRPRSSSDLSSVLSIWGREGTQSGGCSGTQLRLDTHLPSARDALPIPDHVSGVKLLHVPTCRREKLLYPWAYGGGRCSEPPTHRQLLLQADIEVFGLVGLQFLQRDPRLPNELIVAELVLIADRDPATSTR